MPTYEYACQSCGTHVEVYQKFSDAALTECGLCRGPLRKVFHPAGILFKGSGFYATDSRAARTKGASGDGSSKGEGVKSSEAGSSGSGSKSEAASAGSKSGGESSDTGSSGSERGTSATREPSGSSSTPKSKERSA